jgi:hypothetical protein
VQLVGHFGADAKLLMLAHAASQAVRA